MPSELIYEKNAIHIVQSLSNYFLQLQNFSIFLKSFLHYLIIGKTYTLVLNKQEVLLLLSSFLGLKRNDFTT